MTQSVDKDADGSVSRLEGVLHLDGDVKKTKLKLTWLADISDLVPLRLVDFDHLISKKKLEDGDDITDFVTPVSVRQLHPVLLSRSRIAPQIVCLMRLSGPCLLHVRAGMRSAGNRCRGISGIVSSAALPCVWLHGASMHLACEAPQAVLTPADRGLLMLRVPSLKLCYVLSI